MKIVLAAALAFFVLWKMAAWGREGFAPFAWYGRDTADVPAAWGKEISSRTQQKTDGYVDPSEDPLIGAARNSAMAPLSASTNLLPKASPDAGFAQFAPDPKALTGQNFVDASRWVSLGTVGTHRNANYQLRADIPIPKNNKVSPWNNSVIEQDSYRKPLE